MTPLTENPVLRDLDSSELAAIKLLLWHKLECTYVNVYKHNNDVQPGDVKDALVELGLRACLVKRLNGNPDHIATFTVARTEIVAHKMKVFADRFAEEDIYRELMHWSNERIQAHLESSYRVESFKLLELRRRNPFALKFHFHRKIFAADVKELDSLWEFLQRVDPQLASRWIVEITRKPFEEEKEITAFCD